MYFCAYMLFKDISKVVLYFLLSWCMHGLTNAAEIIPNLKAAESKVSMCIGCHAISGYRASYPVVYSVPFIGGQDIKYLMNALKSYQSGDRKHPTMQSIAGSLSEQDIADLSLYYSLQGTSQSISTKLK
jgi:cytochrome c553